jgi:hypothetical protein
LGEAKKIAKDDRRGGVTGLAASAKPAVTKRTPSREASLEDHFSCRIGTVPAGLSVHAKYIQISIDAVLGRSLRALASCELYNVLGAFQRNTNDRI